MPRSPDETKLALLAAGAAGVGALAAEVAHGPPASARAAPPCCSGELGDRRATATLAAAADARDGDPALWLVALEALGAASRTRRRSRRSPAPRRRHKPTCGWPPSPRSRRSAIRARAAVIDAGLGDPDPRIRAAAVRLGRALDPACAWGGRAGARPLADPAAAVRLAAAEATTRCAEARPPRGGAARLDAALRQAPALRRRRSSSLLAARPRRRAARQIAPSSSARVLELVGGGRSSGDQRRPTCWPRRACPRPTRPRAGPGVRRERPERARASLRRDRPRAAGRGMAGGADRDGRRAARGARRRRLGRARLRAAPASALESAARGPTGRWPATPARRWLPAVARRRERRMAAIRLARHRRRARSSAAGSTLAARRRRGRGRTDETGRGAPRRPLRRDAAWRAAGLSLRAAP